MLKRLLGFQVTLKKPATQALLRFHHQYKQWRQSKLILKGRHIQSPAEETRSADSLLRGAEMKASHKLVKPLVFKPN